MPDMLLVCFGYITIRSSAVCFARYRWRNKPPRCVNHIIKYEPEPNFLVVCRQRRVDKDQWLACKLVGVRYCRPIINRGSMAVLGTVGYFFWCPKRVIQAKVRGSCYQPLDSLFVLQAVSE